MIKELLNYNPINKSEQEDKTYMLELFDIYKEKLFSRFKFFHFTASAVVFSEDLKQVLFIYHKIYDSWGWMGGHMDGEFSFLKVAIKEIKEESGIKDLKPIYDCPVSIEILPVWAHFKNNQYISSHQHLNLTYAFTASTKKVLVVNNKETLGVKWIKISKLEKYVTEKEMLPIYKKIIKRVIK